MRDGRFVPSDKTNIAIVGGGPAGLRAAEVAALAGAKVTLYEGKRSVGRKFLVAGKSGLNLTNAESLEGFAKRYRGDLNWQRLLKNFSNDELREWARELGIPTFVSGGNKVFPENMKAAPLLRSWVTKLKALGVEFNVGHRWKGLEHRRQIRLLFENQGQPVTAQHDAVVFALGGASWPTTGSNGQWTAPLEALGCAITELQPANCGWEVEWSPNLLIQEGSPLKNIVARAGEEEKAGELLITKYGLEGAPIYHLGAALRAMHSPEITIDLKPSFTEKELAEKLQDVRKDRTRAARRRWKLDRAASALLGSGGSAQELAHRAKNLVVRLKKPRPIEEAISTAGGCALSQLSEELMIKKLPGVFLAGEMLDWEAPTGGYLLQACFMTGGVAGLAAAQFQRSDPTTL